MDINPFAALEARINAAAERRLANVSVVYQSGAAFGALLSRSQAEPFGGAVDVAGLSVAYCVVNTPGIAEGSELILDGIPHVVTGPVQPDAGGWVELSVYPKA